MIVDPILIVASPRSGTSLLQKFVRECEGVWSLPSEGNEIWDEFCHPRLHGWRSEHLTAEDVTPEARERIPRMFDEQVRSDRFWRTL